MHSSLSTHLHSPKCNDLIQLLLQCHKDHPIRKFVGFCNSPNYQVVECLKEEREINSAINREKAKAKKGEVQQRMKQPLSE